MENQSVQSRVVQISLSLMLGLLIGVFVGRWSAPSTLTVGDSGRSGVRDDRPGPGLGDVASLVGKAKKAIESEGGEGLAAVGGIISNASVSDMIDWGRAPENVSRRIINEMSDDELISTITSLTKLTPEDLSEYSDLRDYANRLTHIAMSGIITDELDADFGGEAPQIQFATGANKSTGARDPRRQFEQDTRKIYAVIPNTGSDVDQLMVHWYLIDRRENMLFDRYRVSPSDDYSYVWLKSPSSHWSPGEYRVQFFSADELLTPIASGTYTVVED